MTRSGTMRICGLALAVATATALAACSSSSSSSSTTTTPGLTTEPGSVGGVPAAGTPSGTAGSITYGFLAADAPNWILPIINAADNSVYNAFDFIWQMWRPLYYTPQGTTEQIDQALSPANLPVWSNGDKTMSITLKPWKWSNGQTLSSKDLEFTFDETKAAVKASPADWADYTPGYFPDTIKSMSTPNSSTLVVNFTTAVNPTFLAEDIIDNGIMPASAWAKTSASGPILTNWNTDPTVATAIFNYLNAQAKSVSTYATNPLWKDVYGPYTLTSFNATTGAFTMVPNTSYSGPHVTPMSNFVGVPFTSDAAEFNAIKAGSIDISVVPPEDAPELGTLKGAGYNYFGEPAFGDYFVTWNFADKTGDFDNIVSQLYFRQAMQHLEDQQGQIKAYLNGDASPGYTVISQYPLDPFMPASLSTNPYPFSISTAESILKSNGWNVVPNGTDTCAKPGTGAGECGAGIPAGTKLDFNLIYNTTAPYTQEDEDLASDAKAAGINISLSGSNFDYIISNYNDTASPANADKWAAEDFGGEEFSTYPTSFGLFNTGGSGQLGNYNNATANSLIYASVSGSNTSAVTNELTFFATNLPVLWQPVRDHIYAWKTDISASTPDAFENLTQYTTTPEFWYITKS